MSAQGRPALTGMELIVTGIAAGAAIRLMAEVDKAIPGWPIA
ncbi:MAG: hypothetical protein NTX53_15270 [candidate division WOR-3 bacterium]|nr:hypothetical protein [candidate division WOR-3 bacterium]